jgi:hypothetical protein
VCLMAPFYTIAEEALKHNAWSMQGDGGFGGEHPKVAAVRAASRERLAKQEAEESTSKEALVKNAATYLENFYQVGAHALTAEE